MQVRWAHLEVAHRCGRVREEALAEGDLQAGFLHPLVQVIKGLVGGPAGRGVGRQGAGRWGGGGQKGKRVQSEPREGGGAPSKGYG